MMMIKDYYDLSVSRTGVMQAAVPSASLGAHFRLDGDARPVFPYIHAVAENATYFDRPESVRFVYYGIQCTVYPGEVLAASFPNEKHAHGFARRLVDFLNDLYERRNSIEPNHRRRKPVSVRDIYKILPQTNCGDCGHAACLAFAAALSIGKANPDQCPGLAAPVSVSAEYPVYDDDGLMVSTVTIELDAPPAGLPATNQPSSPETPFGGRLTSRELEVLRCIVEGSTNVEIADALFISRFTVKSHVVNIMNKLGVNDRTQAAVWAVRNQVI